MNTKNITFSTRLCPIMDFGLYESFLDPYQLYHDDMEEDGYDGDIYREAYKSAVLAEANRIVTDFQKDTGLPFKVEFTAYDSPSYYNYCTDAALMKLELPEDESSFYAKAVQNLKNLKREKEVREYFKNNWASRDGFVSFMTETLDGLVDEFEHPAECRDIEQSIAQYITVMLIEGGAIDIAYPNAVRDYQSRLEEAMLNHSYLDFTAQ